MTTKTITYAQPQCKVIELKAKAVLCTSVPGYEEESLNELLNG